MEWLTSIRKAIDYMEEHLEDNISAQDVADQVFMSSFFFQKGFSLMTGYGLGEYIRNRRLYQAALHVASKGRLRPERRCRRVERRQGTVKEVKREELQDF